jgi:hypothetical protein
MQGDEFELALLQVVDFDQVALGVAASPSLAPQKVRRLRFTQSPGRSATVNSMPPIQPAMPL